MFIFETQLLKIFNMKKTFSDNLKLPQGCKPGGTVIFSQKKAYSKALNSTNSHSQSADVNAPWYLPIQTVPDAFDCGNRFLEN